MTDTDAIFHSLYGEKIDPALSKAFEDALDPSKWVDWCLAHAETCDISTCSDFLEEPFKACWMPDSIVDRYGFECIHRDMNSGEMTLD
jgi:hypothetical protein